MLKHYKITVTGKVQGVWYRQSTLNQAKELNIKGFVKKPGYWRGIYRSRSS